MAFEWYLFILALSIFALCLSACLISFLLFTIYALQLQSLLRICFGFYDLKSQTFFMTLKPPLPAAIWKQMATPQMMAFIVCILHLCVKCTTNILMTIKRFYLKMSLDLNCTWLEYFRVRIARSAPHHTQLCVGRLLWFIFHLVHSALIIAKHPLFVCIYLW